MNRMEHADPRAFECRRCALSLLLASLLLAGAAGATRVRPGALAAQEAPAPSSARIEEPSPGRALGPSPREVVHMVLRAARLVDPERVAQLVRRARLSGLSPTLRLGADRGLRQDLTSQSSTEIEKQAAAVADDFRFDALLTFDLSRLVFAPEEVRLLSVQRWLAGDQRKLAEEAVQLYFRRRKLMTQERSASGAERSELALAIEETESLLDALTDGAYLRALARAQPRSEGGPASH
jgi:hypothetical protein